MKLKTIVEELGFKVHAGDDNLTNEVKGGYTGDLLSDVIANGTEGDIWITRQIHQNIVAVASLKNLAGIVLIQGSEPTPEAVIKAGREGIPLMSSELPAFELSGRIYNLLKTGS